MTIPRTMHYSTLSSESKEALRSGNLTKILVQFKKLQRLFHQGRTSNKGPLHRHVIAMKRLIPHSSKQCTKGPINYSDCDGFSADPEDCVESTMYQDITETVSTNAHGATNNNRPSFLNEKKTMCSRKMTARKSRVLNTRIKNTNEDSLKETIYKHYYQELTKLTKMRAFPVNPSYMSRAKDKEYWLFS